MYLSRLTLNPLQHDARRDLADPYQMHRTLSRAFAPDAQTPPERFLWRQESMPVGGQQGSPVILVQSKIAGNWEALAGAPQYLGQPPQQKSVDLAMLVRTGASLRFRLRANPTRFSGGKRLGLQREEDQLAWMQRKAELSGFELLAVTTTGRERVFSQQSRTSHRMTFDAVQFDGLLRTVDTGLAQQAIRSGLGAAKSMGFGLLSVAATASSSDR